jgi:signal transduction histidine kinase
MTRKVHRIREKSRRAPPAACAGNAMAQTEAAGDGDAAWRALVPLRRDPLDRPMLTAVAVLTAEAGRRIPASLDLDEILRNVGGLTVNWFADWCVVDALNADSPLIRTSVSAADEKDATLARELEEAATDPSQSFPFFTASEPVLVTEVRKEHLRNGAQTRAQFELLRRMGLVSYVTVPLVAGGEHVGTMLIGSKAGPLGPFEAASAREIADIAALAVRTARLLEAARRALVARDNRLAIVAHDLRSPLSTAMFAVGLLRLRLREAGIESMEPTLDIIGRSVEHMTNLIGDLTDVVALDRGRVTLHMQSVPAAVIVEDALDAHRGPASELGVRFDGAAAPEAGPVAADRTRILQVLSNLIGNALKFTERGGSVQLSAEPMPGSVRFTVADTGTGMDAETVQRVFDPFWRGAQAPRSGLGLGLTIARSMVEAHGGSIVVQSQPGQGTQVVVEIPVAATLPG